MGWFSREKKKPELSAEAKANYDAASPDSLKHAQEILKAEIKNPSLTSGQRLSSLAAGTLTSPESVVGSIAGWAGASEIGKELTIESLETKTEGSRKAIKELLTPVDRGMPIIVAKSDLDDLIAKKLGAVPVKRLDCHQPIV